jgi:hypothetical protein
MQSGCLYGMEACNYENYKQNDRACSTFRDDIGNLQRRTSFLNFFFYFAAEFKFLQQGDTFF